MRHVERREEPIPEPAPGAVLVRIAWTALSPGSNTHQFTTGGYRGSPGDPEDILYMATGVVERLGAGVGSLAPGDRVVLTTGHQGYAAVDAARVHRLPAGLGLREAALAYLSSWSVSALHLGRYAAAETVAVIGQGLVGLSAALVADLMGARALALEADPARAAFARSLGHATVIEPGAAGAAETRVAFLAASGSGPDLVLETSGSWTGLRAAIDLARDFTRIAIMGIYRQPPPAELGLDLFHALNRFPSRFHYRRIELIGVGSDPETVVAPNRSLATTGSNFRYVLEQAARGRLPLGRLVTHVLPPDQIGAALERLAAGDRSLVGVVFDWGLDQRPS
jgi:threonine dehydrogenase-like Zn-dependent dehydrogenase